MREFIDVTGKTEDEAIAKALAQLGLDRDDVSVEILERAKSGFLGIGSSPAKVRVKYGPEEEEVVIPSAAPVVEEVKTAPKQTEKNAEKKPEKKVEKKTEKKPAPAKEKAPKQAEPVEEAAPVVDLGEEVNDEKAQAIRAFLSGLLEQMECPAEIHVYLPEKGRYKVILEGKNLGALIGRRGETLDAIQQLTNYSVNRGSDKRVRVHVDAENYRLKREQSLEHLAEKVAQKVLKYRRNVTLEPMNAYERHVIHAALQDYRDVSTHSTGTEPNRRIVVSYNRK